MKSEASFIKGTIIHSKLERIRQQAIHQRKKWKNIKTTEAFNILKKFPIGAVNAVAISTNIRNQLYRYFKQEIVDGIQSFCSVEDLYNFHSKITETTRSKKDLSLTKLKKNYKEIISTAYSFSQAIKEIVSLMKTIEHKLVTIPKNVESFFKEIKKMYDQTKKQEDSMKNRFSTFRKRISGRKHIIISNQSKHLQNAISELQKKLIKAKNPREISQIQYLLNQYMNDLKQVTSGKLNQYFNQIEKRRSSSINRNRRKFTKSRFEIIEKKVETDLRSLQKLVDQKFSPAIKSYQQLVKLVGHQRTKKMKFGNGMTRITINKIEVYIGRLKHLMNVSKITLLHSGQYRNLVEELKIQTSKVSKITEYVLSVTNQINSFVYQIHREEKDVQNKIGKYFKQEILLKTNRRKWFFYLTKLFNESKKKCGCN